MFDRDDMAVEVISLCGTDGKMQPLRFRFKDENNYLQTANVLEILDVHKVDHVGAESFRYLCKTEACERHHLMELVYAIRSHRWTLTRKLY